jgi:hypothetical protein
VVCLFYGSVSISDYVVNNILEEIREEAITD